MGGMTMFVLSFVVLFVYNNYEAIGNEGWDLFQQKHKTDQNLLLDTYIYQKLNQFKTDLAIF